MPGSSKLGPRCFGIVASLAWCAALFGTACKSKETSAEATAEAMSTLENCQKRNDEWKHRIRRSCTTCLTLAAQPKCGDCQKQDYAAACAKEDAARRADDKCDEVTVCRHNCKDDCACMEKCYEGNEECKKLYAAVDTCLTEVCAEHCR